MKYYSHVLHYDNPRHPFDKAEFRWPSFIGEFVAPLVDSRPDLLFWFSHYTDCSRFRVYTDAYDEFQGELEGRRDKLGLIDKGEEKTHTLLNDLGHGRFISPSSKSSPQKRAELILRSLCSASKLVIDSVVKRNDGYWQFEENKDLLQNPDGCHLFSVTHLYHNMAASDGLGYIFNDVHGMQFLSYYYFLNKHPNGAPGGQQGVRFQM